MITDVLEADVDGNCTNDNTVDETDGTRDELKNTRLLSYLSQRPKLVSSHKNS